MRRLALNALTACALAFLSACSGGTGFGNTGSTIDSIVFSNGSGQVNDFFVAPGGNAPVAISGIGVQGSSTRNIVFGQTFTWRARLVNPLVDPASIATYTTGVSPATFKTCGQPSATVLAAALTTPPTIVLTPAAGSVHTNGYAGYAALPATQLASTVYVGAVPGVPAPYCLLVTATHPSDGVVGTVTVVVSSSP